MSRVHFAILAHTHGPLVLDLITSLRELNPGAAVSVFNGGRDPGFLSAEDVEINPLSRRVRYGNMTPFHFGTIEWLTDDEPSFDYLVTLDHDVMCLRPGFSSELPDWLTTNGYAGARFREAPDPGQWTLGGSTIPQIHRHWQQTWKPLLGLQHPFWAFNPVQVFGRTLVQSMRSHERYEDIKAKAVNSRIWAIEEVIIPSLAVSAGAKAQELRGGRAINWSNCSARAMQDFYPMKDVHFVHRVPMRADAPERLTALALRSDRAIEQAWLTAPPTEEPAMPLMPRWSPSRWKHAAVRRYELSMAKHRG